MVHLRAPSIVRLRLPPLPRSLKLSNHQLAKAIFQRIPPLSQLACLVMAIYGPRGCPWAFSFLLLFVHIVFVASNARTAWGMRYACKKVEEFASTNWREASRDINEFDHVRHLIILPAYKESTDTLSETLDVLASHPAAVSSYRVCLAMEEKDAGGAGQALQLIAKYQHLFLDIDFTLHPYGIEEEAAGKSSNIAWASREMWFRGKLGDIVTVMDADTTFASDFFASVASKWVQATPAARDLSFFVAPIFFDRNASDVAAPVRTTDILWSAAGLGTMTEGSLMKLPTSAYAVSSNLVVSLSFWDAGPEAIGEDLHMAVKAYLETSGSLNIHAIYSPASQCNVVGFRYPRAPGSKLGLRQMAVEWTSDLFARYSQAKRHMWGGLDSGYAFRRIAFGRFGIGSDRPPLDEQSLRLEEGGSSSLRLHERLQELNSRSAFRFPPSPSDQLTPSSDLSETESTYFGSGSTPSYETPATSVGGSPKLESTELGAIIDDRFYLSRSSSPVPTSTKVPFLRTVILMSRLYEAHFNLGFLFMLLSVAPYFNPGLAPIPLWNLRPATAGVLAAERLPEVVLIATSLSSHLGTLAFICTASIFFYYERFHHIATTKRWQNRPHLGARAQQQATRSFPSNIATYLAIPATLFFGILPLYHAQLCHLWTNRLVYQVSAKPTLEGRPIADIKLSSH